MHERHGNILKAMVRKISSEQPEQREEEEEEEESHSGVFLHPSKAPPTPPPAKVPSPASTTPSDGYPSSEFLGPQRVKLWTGEQVRQLYRQPGKPPSLGQLLDQEYQQQVWAEAGAASASSGPASTRPPLRAETFGRWLRMSNALLYRQQRRDCAQMLRDLWSSVTRAGNRLRRSHWEAWRHEFGMVVSKARATAPKPKQGKASSVKPPTELP